MTRAIILAAGKGTRLLPYTLNTHKALMKIDGDTIIEKLIQQLLDDNIKDIVVVVGYLHEQFYFLTDKYGVELIYNNKYEEYNNFYSLYLVRHLLGDSFIIESDVFIKEFKFNLPTHSVYYVKKTETEKQEWIVNSNNVNRIKDIYVDFVKEDNVISAGITYLTECDGRYLNKLINQIFMGPLFYKDMYWDDMLVKNLNNLEIYSELIQENTVFEIDDIKDLLEVKKMFEKEDKIEVF